MRKRLESREWERGPFAWFRRPIPARRRPEPGWRRPRASAPNPRAPSLTPEIQGRSYILRSVPHIACISKRRFRERMRPVHRPCHLPSIRRLLPLGAHHSAPVEWLSSWRFHFLQHTRAVLLFHLSLMPTHAPVTLCVALYRFHLRRSQRHATRAGGAASRAEEATIRHFAQVDVTPHDKATREAFRH